MKQTFEQIEGGITAPAGFKAGGLFCDIKQLGTGKGSQKGQKRDLALLVSERPSAVAGMFTTNQVCAAPVKLCLERVKKGKSQALVVNSGNANACTGKQGMKDAQKMTALAAQSLGLRAEDVLAASTGRIGVLLPMKNVERGIRAAAGLLGRSTEHAGQFAEAIMTSDTRPKQIAVRLSLGGKLVIISGACKGAGMIQPGMSATAKRPAATPSHATMLAFLTTDAAVGALVLRQALQEAVAQSFNRITVDGDMSTNDTVLLWANGVAGNAPLTTPSRNKAHGGKARPADAASIKQFQAALNFVCLELAKMIVRDGEGVSRLVTVRVRGARSHAEADAAARAVGNSMLVKTSWCGGDPNWGRILDALGYSSAHLIEEKVDLAYSAPGSRKLVYSLRKGQPSKTSFDELCKMVASREFDLHIHLNQGQGEALLYATDLTEAYVEFNKGDVADPHSLGG